MLKNVISCFLSVIILLFFCSEVKAGVLINEFSSYDSTADWVELYSNEDTNISGWILRDTATSKMATIPDGISVGPSSSSFYVVDVGNRLNVDKDIVKLLKSDDSTNVDEIDYGGSDQVCAPGLGQSVGRVDNGNTIERFATPTKGATNVGASLAPCPTPTPQPTDSPTPTPTASPTPIRTNSPTPTPTPTPIPTSAKVTPWPTATPNPIADDQTGVTNPDILGLRDSLSPAENPIASSSTSPKSNFPVVAAIFIFSGVGLMGGAGYMAYKKQKENSSGTINE